MYCIRVGLVSLLFIFASQTLAAQEATGSADGHTVIPMDDQQPEQPQQQQPQQQQPQQQQPQQAAQPQPYAQPAWMIEQEQRRLERERILMEREQIRAERLAEQQRKKEEARASGAGLLKVGGITLGSGYGASIIIGSILMSGGVDRSWLFFIPVVGSPLYAGLEFGEINDNEARGFLTFLFTLPAIAQSVGIGFLIAGSIRRARYNETKVADMMVTPLITKDTGGLAFSMVF